MVKSQGGIHPNPIPYYMTYNYPTKTAVTGAPYRCNISGAGWPSVFFVVDLVRRERSMPLLPKYSFYLVTTQHAWRIRENFCKCMCPPPPTPENSWTSLHDLTGEKRDIGPFVNKNVVLTTVHEAGTMRGL